LIVEAWDQAGNASAVGPDEQSPINQSGGLANSVTYVWATPGDKRITVTATNATATVSQVLTITIGVEPTKAMPS
jgi:hypothetical protein